jgi:MerR family transcriptional regulator, light-induced transcriptional regulator
MADAKSNLASKGQIEAGRRAASPAHFGFPVPAGNEASDHAEDRNARLRMMIECEIIPSLMMAHGERFCVNPLISALIDVADFTALVMTEDEAAVLSHIDELRRRGLTVDMICVELLAPTVNRLSRLLNEQFVYVSHVDKGLARVDAAIARLKERRIS